MAKLQKGINDLKTWCLNNGDWGQQLLNEWTGDCDDGKHYEIDGISFGSQKKFKWRCKEGHEWYAVPLHRTRQRSCCPYCSGHCVSDKNSLKTWCLNNGDFGTRLMQEWTGECDDGKHYDIDEVARSSGRKFKWRCKEGHEWFAVVGSRTNNKHGCQICSNDMRGARTSKSRLHKGTNDLQTWCLNNGDFGQQLLNDWTGECDDGKHYEIYEVSLGSAKKFKWRCDKGHEWYAPVNRRTNVKSGCPCCNDNVRSDRVSKARLHSGLNDLKTWCIANGAFGQQLMSEWTGECEDGKHYEFDEVSFGSKKKFKWRCDKGHEWYALILTRTHRNCVCNQCSNAGTSYQEQFIYWSLKQIYPNTENRCRVLKSPQNPHGIEFDIGIPDIPLCIEYSPTAWHRDKQERDNYKKELCEKAKVRLIQIIEDSYNELEHAISDNYICFKMDYHKQDETLVCIIDHILKSIGHSISEINIELAKKNAFEYSRGKVEHEKSLEFNYPELAKELHQTLNNGLKPADITCGSNRKIYWQCQKCGYGSNGEWKAPPSRRRANGYETGCPQCGYNWSDSETHKTYRSTVVYKGVNDLQSQHPELTKEWHPTLNKDLKPEEIKCYSGKQIYWQCQKCGYGSNGEWHIQIGSRTVQKSGCPRCGYNWSDGKIHKTSGSTLVIKGVNDLHSQFPELVKEWHPILNEDLKPDELKCGSHKKVYWQCTVCNHGSSGEWCTVARDRVHRKSGCPQCGYNWYKAQQGLPQKYKGKYSYLNDHQTP